MSDARRFLTGATDGIGLDLARRWCARGTPALYHGRRAFEELGEMPFERARYLRADLADPGAPEALERALGARGVDALDRLVLNAAAGWIGPIERQDESALRALVEIDLLSTMRLVQLLLPRLRRARGRIVFVSSVVTALPRPAFAAYAALKSAAEGFFRALRAELRGTVEVQVLRPGPVRTGLHGKSGADLEAIGWRRFPDVERVARAIDRRIESRRASWAAVGAASALLWQVGRNFPGLVDRVQERRRW